MLEFKDRVAQNNKQKLKIYNSNGVLQETQSVEVLRDSTIEGRRRHAIKCRNIQCNDWRCL